MHDDPIAVAGVAAPLFASLMANHGEVELDDAIPTQRRLARAALSQARILLGEARRDEVAADVKAFLDDTDLGGMTLAQNLLAVADRLEAAQRHCDETPIEGVGLVWADTDEVIAAQLELRRLAAELEEARRPQETEASS